MDSNLKGNILKNFFYGVKKINSIDKSMLFMLFISALLSVVTNFLYPYVLKVVVEAIEQHKEFKDMMIDLFIILTISCITYSLRSIIQEQIWYRTDKTTTLISRELAFKSLNMDYEKLERPEMQDAFEKASRGGLVNLVVYGFETIGKILAFFVGCGIVMTASPWLVLIIVALSIGKLFLKKYDQEKEKSNFRDRLPTIWRKISYCDGASKNLTFGKDIRIYRMDKFIQQERDEAIKEYNVLNKSNLKRSYIITELINILVILEELSLYFFMIRAVIYDNMTIATFTFMVSSVRNLTWAIGRIIDNYGRLLSFSLRVNDYRSFLSYELEHNSYDQEIKSNTLSIEFQDVYYSYYLQEGYALENVSFKIEPGEKIALVGFNGAGKTTLIKLLCGLYHPTKGKILINGINIESITRENLCKLIAPVFQDTINYAFEIQENIAMESSNRINNDKLTKAINLVDLSEKIESLPNKEKTIITRELDDNGIELSGGENQKLSLARAIYKDALLMILDEPTSAMDAIGEYNLYNNFKSIIGSHSAIFISHRLSSTKFCDRILLLDKGKLIEEGTHEKLMSFDSEYKKLFSMQAEYYKGGENNA